jgi:riboflavin kinase/FMN adenylyltransferase
LPPFGASGAATSHHMNLPISKDLPTFVIARDPPGPPPGLDGAVYVIGNFDGVHRGHRAVIERARAMADRMGAPCAALTFEPHPGDFFAKRANAVFRLTPEGAKARALRGLGLDGMVTLTFDAALAGSDPETFVVDTLLRRLGLKGAVVGYDFHFGKNRAGTPAFLADAGARHGFPVEIVDKIIANPDGSSEAVHAATAREALEKGDVARARLLLGYPWFVVGTVIHGQELGRTLGFPTANIALDPSCRLAFGIYAVRMTVDGVTRDGVASYGRRPTVDNGAPLLEVFLFDFSGDLYGKEVEVSFLGWIRGEEKFDGLDALVEQIRRDVEAARRILAGSP